MERVVLRKNHLALLTSPDGAASTALFLDGRVADEPVNLDGASDIFGGFPANQGRVDVLRSVEQCPLCAAGTQRNQQLFVVRQLFWDVSVQRCRQCGLVFKGEFPSSEVLSWVYSSRYTHFQGSNQLDVDLRQYAGRVARLGRPIGSSLDIGCGAGGFVAAALERGWDAYGIDPYLPEADSRLKSRLTCAPATDYALENAGKFERVTLWAAWEHLVDPWPTIQAAFRMLRPGGTLLFNSPRGDCLHARLKGSLWSMVSLLEHLTFLTPEAAAYLAKKLGASRFHVRFCGVPFPVGISDGKGDRQGLNPPVEKTARSSTAASRRAQIIRLAQESKLMVRALEGLRVGDHLELSLTRAR